MMSATITRLRSAAPVIALALILAARAAAAQAAQAAQAAPGSAKAAPTAIGVAPGASATASPATAAVPQPDGWQPAAADAGNRCLVCHAAQREAATVGVHSENGVRCVDCHGGNAAARTREEAHGSGFTGALDKAAVARLCGSCHSDPNRMREYGLPTGQLAEFRTSRHGQLLFERHNVDAPTCTDCHGTHIIYPPYDARSRVYAKNIPTTCAHCHANPQLMQKYGLRTDQLEQFRASAHGVTLFEEQDFAAPTCVACHGAHSALPPTRTEVASVCGNCHQLVAQAFNAGPHGVAARAGRIDGCLACHGNHSTQRIGDDSVSAMCDRCHARDTKLHQVGVDLQRRMSHASADMRSAERALVRLTASGQRMSDARFRYQSALTWYLQIAQVQHGLDLDRVETLEGRVSAGSIELDRMATSSEETRWEHKLILLPLWFLTLSAVALAWLTLRALHRGGGDGEL